MCVMSMVIDHYKDKWTPSPGIFQPVTPPATTTPIIIQGASKEDLEALRKEVLEMKALLIRALEYDKKNDEPHCEAEEKVAFIRQMAKLVGVDLEDVLSKQ